MASHDTKPGRASSMTRREQRAHRQRAVRRARARSAVSAMRATTIVLAAAVVAAIAGVGGTYAFLTAQASPPSESTISAGTLTLTINGGQTATLGAMHLSPAAGQARAVTVANTGNVAVDLGVTANVTSTDLISTNAVARLTRVATATACTTTTPAPTASLISLAATPGSLAPGESAVLCLEVGLQPTTPASRSGQGLTFSLTVTGTQKAT